MNKLFRITSAVLLLMPASELWAQNLVRKPDFGTSTSLAAAPADFTTSIPSGDPTKNNNTYAVVATYGTFFDHTVGTNTGAFLAVNGPSAATLNNTAWQQTIAVQPNQVYTFAYWQRNLVTANPATIRLLCTGNNTATVTATPVAPASAAGYAAATANWEPVVYTVSSGTNTQLTLGLQDITVASNGNVFGIDDISLVPLTIKGTVFEDVNYGGGAGRSLATAASSATASGFLAAIGRVGATVELYTSAGVLAATTTTNATGAYTFANQNPGTYTVRVVSGTVTSARTGSASGLLPVVTYLNGATDRVGGSNPALPDAPANAGTAALSLLTTTTQAVEAQSTVTLSTTSSTSGVDFGFNFDLVVNTNNSGQGSLRQFVLNANALGDEAKLAQAGSYLNEIVGANPINASLPSGVETSIFMVPSGKARSGLRAADGTATGGPASQLTNGVAIITPTSTLPLPAISGPATAINGWTQGANIGNTNDVTLGLGGTTGTDGSILPQVNGPEVQITGTSAVAVGLDVTDASTGSSILGLAIYGFGTRGNDDNYANIRIAASQVSVQGTLVGSSATIFARPTGGSSADGIRVTSGTGLRLLNNYIGFNSGKGITTRSGVTGATISVNEIRSNGLDNSAWDGLDLQGSASIIRDNLFINNTGVGMDGYQTAGGNTWSGNTVTGNGGGTSGTSGGTGETAGVRVYGTNSTISQNIIYSNYGAGIMVTPRATKNIISQNAIYDNGAGVAANNGAASGQVGIDLLATGQAEATGTPTYVTLNSTTTGGANSLLNYPILQTARINGSSLVVTGIAAAGLTVELFLATRNAVANPTQGNNFGQGASFINSTVLTTSGGTGSYSGVTATTNGIDQGSGTNVNTFTITISLGSLTAAQRTSLTASGAYLTSTASLASLGTSEFSGVVPVTSGPTAFNITNLNVAANSVAAALNPGLTVPQAASDPVSSIISFTVFPATNGTLLYNNAAIPTGGQLIPVANTNQLTFRPTVNSTAAGTFSFFASNAAGGTAGTSNTATYTIPVIASNNPYVANDDGLDVPKNTATKGNVLLNDTQPANATTAFTVTQVGTGPTYGTLALNTDGTYTYTPNTDRLGSDSFQYQVCQAGVCSNTATVTINLYDPVLVCNSTNGPNLLQNPGFEQGNSVFSSAYNYVSAAANAATGGGNTGLVPETTYAVDANANTYHPSFKGLARGGSGNFMIVNGAANQSKIYAQTVNVVANRYYNYSGWASSVNSASPAILGFVINGKSTSASATLPTTISDYVQFSGVWYSGNSNTATFEVRDINRATGGNDFGLDDLYFGTCSVNLVAANIMNAPGIPALAPPTSIAPLDATVSGPGAAVASFTIQSLPASGTLRLGSPTGAVVTLGQVISYAQKGALYYTPATGFSGNATFTYTATDTENAGSNNIASYTIPVSSSPLPVQLATFTAIRAGTSAQLDWITASELNNAYFAIERSITGLATSFVAIDKVAGHGSLATATAYRFVDRNAVAVGQLVYYRLRQVDASGTSSYSPVRIISFAASHAILSLYPNPTAGPGTSLDLSQLPATNTYQVRIVDATGRALRQWVLAGGQPQPLPVADLAAGIYLVLVSGTQPDGSTLRQVLHLMKE
ncbi:Ig-like domain-containing protein [Hymenobacter sp. H14-R3]|uniref:beta strand repeat-containing protein n=1 Tax=Hymenobacter sp. H14-R3 TaxID=3046308 RepID=UPI0024B9C07F|nr:Ig-like domain-containing protein [Hymenobacter sp. H14-R3]MDJ0363844.1 Ig-like domain-containing protein [Hymenobacter sp. H14-R3]